MQFGPFAGVKSKAKLYPSSKAFADMSIGMEEAGSRDKKGKCKVGEESDDGEADGTDVEAFSKLKVDEDLWLENTMDDTCDEDGDVDWAMDGSYVGEDVSDLAMGSNNDTE